jgi:hypothetical protein
MQIPSRVNVYAMRCGSRYFLIDTGVGLDTNRIMSELESDKIQVAPVFSSRQTANALEHADEQAISLAAAKIAGIYGPEVRLSACPVERVLEDSGDTVSHSGKILQSTTWDCDPQAYAATLRILGELRIDGLYPGHGLSSVTDRSRHLEQSLRFVNQLLLPPNLM